MPLIQITSDENFIYVEFNNAAQEWERVKLKRSQARSVCKMIEDKGVEIIWSDSKSFILKHEYIDTINNTEVTNNETLYNLLIELMKA